MKSGWSRLLLLLPLLIGAADLRAAETGPAPDAAWNADRAMADISQQLQWTPRSLGAPGHAQVIAYIRQELALVKNTNVELQTWTIEGPNGAPLSMTNIIARMNPDNPHRIIAGTHYDSIVKAYADKHDPDAPMPGANNSASGVALLLETIRALAKAPPLNIGVDFIFFDGEEGINSLGAGDSNWAALGSPFFAAHIGEYYPAGLPKSGVIFDMVCARDMRLLRERNSVMAAENEVAQFWRIGEDIAPDIFVDATTRMAINDDQNALIQVGIPSFLVIGFDYAPWFNTTQDTIDKCSGSNLQAVGRTLLRYLQAQ